MENKLVMTTIPLDDLIAMLGDVVDQKVKDRLKAEREEIWLSPTEACKMFQPKICKGTVFNWISLGYLRSKKVGGKVFVSLSSILEDGVTLKKYKRPINV